MTLPNKLASEPRITATTSKGEAMPLITVTTTVSGSIEAVFNHIVPIDLSRIFEGTRLIPGIRKTSLDQGWNKPGLTRTIYFNDGSTSRESLLTVVPNQSFSYKNDHFTSTLRFLAKRIEGEWEFNDLDSGQVGIVWTYRVIPLNAVNLFLMNELKAMLVAALEIIKRELEELAHGSIDKLPA